MDQFTAYSRISDISKSERACFALSRTQGLGLPDEWVDPSSLCVNPFLARVPRQQSVAALARWISSHGFAHPILVTDEGIVIAGLYRFLAARQLGLGRVPIVRWPDSTDMPAHLSHGAVERGLSHG